MSHHHRSVEYGARPEYSDEGDNHAFRKGGCDRIAGRGGRDWNHREDWWQQGVEKEAVSWVV